MPDSGHAFFGPLSAAGGKGIRGYIHVRSSRVFVRQPVEISGLKRPFQRHDSLGVCDRRSAAKNDRYRLRSTKRSAQEIGRDPDIDLASMPT